MDFCPPSQPGPLGGKYYPYLLDLVAASRRPREDATRVALRLGAMQFGQSLLEAASVEELDEKLDEIAWDESFHDYYATLDRTDAPPLTAESVHRRHRVISRWTRNPKLREKVDKLERAFLGQLHFVKQIIGEDEENGGARRTRRAAGPEVNLRRYLYDLAAPDAIIQCMIGGIRCFLAQLALAEGSITGQIEEWQSEALLDFAIAGVTHSLRFTQPGTPYVHEFVEDGEFISWNETCREFALARIGLETIAQRADESRKKVYPIVGGNPRSTEEDAPNGMD